MYIDNTNGIPLTEYLEYDMFTGYSVYVKGNSIYFTIF